MHLSNQLVVFALDEGQYALPLSIVERVVRAVEVTPLPDASDTIFGVINVQGRIIPVINLREYVAKSRIHPDGSEAQSYISSREIALSDRFIIARTSGRTVALVVDEVSGVTERSPEKVIMVEEILAGMADIQGVVKFEDGMILILNLDTFLCFEEDQTLGNAIDKTMKDSQ